MTYFIQFGIYSRKGYILNTQNEEVEADTVEEAIEEVFDLEQRMEDTYACVMVDIFENEKGEEIEYYESSVYESLRKDYEAQ